MKLQDASLSAESRDVVNSFIQAISIAPLLSTTTQKRSRHSTDTVSEFHDEAPQATVISKLHIGYWFNITDAWRITIPNFYQGVRPPTKINRTNMVLNCVEFTEKYFTMRKS